jgi:hypothetical protein
MPKTTGEQSGRAMLLKILLVGAVLIGVMAAIRDGRVLKDAGLLSSCNAVVVDGKTDPTMLSCTKGRLDGFPNMTNKSCTLVATRPKHEFWRCQAPVLSSPVPNGG